VGTLYRYPQQQKHRLSGKLEFFYITFYNNKEDKIKEDKRLQKHYIKAISKQDTYGNITQA
jgi:hypothetical protein